MKRPSWCRLALVAALALLLAPPSSADSVRLEGVERQNVEVDPISLTPFESAQRRGEPVPFDLRTHVTNTGPEALGEGIYLALEARRPDGTVRSFSGFPVTGTFRPGLTVYSRALVRGLTVVPGDRVTVGLWDEAQRKMTSSGPDGICEVWCELCFSRAQQICQCGVEQVSCSCNGSRSCSFSCFPCPE